MGDYGGEFSAGRETIQGGARKILDVSWYHLYGYRAHGELMAFLAVWEFDTFLFVEHFGREKIMPKRRTWSGTSDTADDAEQKAGYTGGGTADR